MSNTIKSKLIPANWEIPDYFHQRLGDQPGRQRAMCEHGHLLLVLHEPPALNERKRRHRLIYRSPDGTWLSSSRGTGLAELNQLLDSFEQRFTQLEQQSEVCQTANEFLVLTEAVIPLRRSAQNLYETLQSAREQMPDLRELINLRDRAYELSRTGELLAEEIASGKELAQLRRAEDQNQAARTLATQAHRLNLVAGFFLPLVTLATIFSINLNASFVDTLTHPTVLWVCALGVILGMVLSGMILAFYQKD